MSLIWWLCPNIWLFFDMYDKVWKQVLLNIVFGTRRCFSNPFPGLIRSLLRDFIQLDKSLILIFFSIPDRDALYKFEIDVPLYFFGIQRNYKQVLFRNDKLHLRPILVLIHYRDLVRHDDKVIGVRSFLRDELLDHFILSHILKVISF